MITLGLADDQALFLHGIRNVIDSQPDLEVRWLAANGAEAIEASGNATVDVVLMDVQMPVLDGIAATRQVVAKHPATKVIILTTFDDEAYVLGGLGAGASGFLLKDAEPEALLDAIRTVAHGDAVISPRATNRVVAKLHAPDEETVALSPADRLAFRELTEREREVLVAIGRGWSNGEIAQRMFISMPTVKTHVGRVLAKTQSRDRVHAALFAYRTGLVSRADLLDS
ncbi:response regulator [Corynebacterium coyleae]|uniref:response regulator n=1 Tax=Corynebacterium coyleae TaxID=53374 RepID=UPI002550116D|nr:response regulator transcription factor [Corynebacterium coyleae]MDK8663268.1 response regulator transcription factor [Corynebacterium coyleae]MDK8706386.1 response regulator transcription factor [Corynebacterium coyleae]MDK8733223.1 response regulator transcription factor [Corynebacterium coyleae]MDK8892428.1 response regulator transcription factor [Corynebacterium coyleae]